MLTNYETQRVARRILSHFPYGEPTGSGKSLVALHKTFTELGIAPSDTPAPEDAKGPEAVHQLRRAYKHTSKEYIDEAIKILTTENFDLLKEFNHWILQKSHLYWTAELPLYYLYGQPERFDYSMSKEDYEAVLQWVEEHTGRKCTTMAKALDTRYKWFAAAIGFYALDIKPLEDKAKEVDLQ
jgi:hypothetical protein